jgi:glucosamine-6-phosphate deaminase
MQIRILKDKEIASIKIAHYIINMINKQNKFNIGLATGATYLYTYNFLIKAYKSNKISFKNVNSFNLDEYVDIEINHRQSYKCFMKNHLFGQIDIKIENIHFPPTERGIDYTVYDREIALKGGIDLQLLGIGKNGHIGFNEPGNPFNIKTHLISLTSSTRQSNKRFFNNRIDEVPKYAVTMGIDTIMQAKEIIISAFGKNKAHVVKEMIYGKISENLPASILQKHPHVTVFLDEQAASKVLSGRGRKNENNH